MNTKAQLLIIFIIALAIRLFVNIYFQGINSSPDPNLGSDHIEYDAMAQSFVSGQGFSISGEPITRRPPGVPFLLAPIYYFFGVNYTIVRIIFSLMGAITCLVVYSIAKTLDQKQYGIIAATLLAVYPIHFYYSMHLFSEVPWALFMSLAVLCLVDYEMRDKAYVGILAGFFLGISAFMRPISLFYPCFYGVLCLVFYQNGNAKKMLKLIFIPLIAMIVIVAPWIARNYQLTGHITPISTHGGVTFWGAHNEKILNDPKNIGRWIAPSQLPEFFDLKTRFESIDPYRFDKECYQKGKEFVKRHLTEMPKLELMKLYRLLTPNFETPNRLFNVICGSGWAVLAPFVFIGIALTVRNKQFIPLHACMALIISITLVYYGDHRFWMSVSPFLVLYAAISLSWLWQTFVKKECARGKRAVGCD